MALPHADGAKLLANFFAQRAKRAEQLGYPDDARRFASYGLVALDLGQEIVRLQALVREEWRGLPVGGRLEGLND